MTNQFADIRDDGLTSVVGAERRPYPAYKDSGVEWLGEVPVYWELKRLKYSALLCVDKLDVKPVAQTYIGLENIESWTGRLLLQDQPESVDSSIGRFKAGDVLFGKLRPYLAKVVRPDFNGVSTGELVVLRPVGSSQGYLFYCLLNEPYIRWVDTLAYGTKMPRVSPSQVGNSMAPLPPLPEQHTIAAFLDRETAKIDALVAKKERLIELLQEQRTALITQAVTKGLDPDVPMKDSGVEWLGEVPEHWEVKQLKRLAFMQAGTAITGDDIGAEGDYPVFGGNGVRGYTSSFTHEGEFPLVGRQGALCGCVNFATGKFWASEHAVVLRPNAEVNPNWLAQLLQAMSLNQYSQSAAQPGLSVETIGSIAAPAALKTEQRAIAAFLDRETAQIDALVAKIRKVIDLLREQRTALISAAVTGKIDVREAMA